MAAIAAASAAAWSIPAWWAGRSRRNIIVDTDLPAGIVTLSKTTWCCGPLVVQVDGGAPVVAMCLVGRWPSKPAGVHTAATVRLLPVGAVGAAVSDPTYQSSSTAVTATSPLEVARQCAELLTPSNSMRSATWSVAEVFVYVSKMRR